MKRVFLVTGISALAFLILAEYFPFSLIPSIIIFFAAVGILSAVARGFCGIMKRFKGKNYPKIKSVLEVSITLCLSVAIVGSSYLFSADKFNSVINQYDGKSISCTLQIVSEEEFSQSGYGYFEAVPVSGMDTQGFKVKIFTKGLPDAEVYDFLAGTFEFSAPDEEYFLLNRAEGVALSAFANEVHVELNSNRPFWFKIIEMRRYIQRSITANLGKSHGFVKALLLGDRSDLETEEFDSLRNSGLLHITAVSGLHVGIAASFILVLLSFIKNRWIRYGAVFVSLLILAAVTGFSPSVIRSVFMLAAGYLGLLMFKPTDSLNLLGAVLTFCLLVSPFSAFSASLLLSFSAKAGLVVFARPLQIAITTWLFKLRGKYLGKFGTGIVSTFSVSLACTVFTVPVSMFLFGTFSMAGLITNLLCLWLIKYIFIFSTVAVLLSALPLKPIFTVISVLVNWSVKYIMKISDIFSDSILSQLNSEPFTIILAAVIGYIVYLLMGKERSKKTRKKRSKQIGRLAAAVISAVLVVVVSSVANKVSTPSDNKLHTVFVDVGQGCGSYISINEKAVIFDCGGSKEPGEAMNEALLEAGIKEIDYIVLSHLHDDHTNGIEEIFRQWEIDEVIVPYTEGDPAILIELMMLAAEEGAEVVTISEDMTRNLGDARIDLLTEHLDPESSDQNENSIVSAVTLVNYRVLFTGDITSAAEKRLVKSYGWSLKSSVLSVPHHGSKYSSSEEFLEMVSPELSIISVGKNSYGHPGDRVLELLLDYGEVLTTQTLGNIEIVTDGVNIEILQ